MDFFENIDALLWRLAAILALVLFFVLQVRSSELVPFIYSQF